MLTPHGTPGRAFLQALGALALLGASCAVAANWPLGNNTGTPPLSATADFGGHFSNPQLQLYLQLSGLNQYQGYLSSNGQHLPVQAVVQNGVLNGVFQSGGQHYSFTAQRSGNALQLDAGGSQHWLHSQSAAPNPGLNPLANLPPSGSPAAPGMGSPLSAAPGMPTPLPGASLMSAPSAPPGMPGAVGGYDPVLEYSRLSNQTGLALMHFITSLRYWLGETPHDTQARFLIEQELLPAAADLSARLGQMNSVLQQLLQRQTLQAQETLLLQKLAGLCQKGGTFYADWQNLLQNLLQLSQSHNQAQIKTLAANQLPQAIKGSMAFTNDFILSIRLTHKVLALQSGVNSTPAASLSPVKIMKWETVRNMSEIMRDGMSLLRDMQK